jgi:hypothetical protein
VIVDANGYVPRAGYYGIEQIAAGWGTTCVLLSDGTVRCAGNEGYNGDGTRGDGLPPPGRHLRAGAGARHQQRDDDRSR